MTETELYSLWCENASEDPDLQKELAEIEGAVKISHSFSSKEQASFNFMATVTICSDSGAKKIKSDTVFTFCPSICHEVMEPDAMILIL